MIKETAVKRQGKTVFIGRKDDFIKSNVEMPSTGDPWFLKNSVTLIDNETRYEKRQSNRGSKRVPQEFNLDELMERLVFIEKVEKGLKQLEEGKTVPHDTVKELTKKW